MDIQELQQQIKELVERVAELEDEIGTRRWRSDDASTILGRVKRLEVANTSHDLVLKGQPDLGVEGLGAASKRIERHERRIDAHELFVRVLFSFLLAVALVLAVLVFRVL